MKKMKNCLGLERYAAHRWPGRTTQMKHLKDGYGDERFGNVCKNVVDRYKSIR